MLQLRLRGVQPSALIVGEGDVAKKVERAGVYLTLLGWEKGTVVVPGVGSHNVFDGDGDDLALPGVRDVGAVEAVLPTDATTWVSTLTTLVDRRDMKSSHRFPQPTLLYLKPPRELKLAESQDPAGAEALFGRVTLTLYGSWNLREGGVRLRASVAEPRHNTLPQGAAIREL